MRPRAALIAASGAALLTGWPLVSGLRAADYGQMGQTFPIIETDLLTTIETRLAALEANGGIARMQRQMQEQAVASVRRPKPVGGMTPAIAKREWLFDPSIVTEDDIVDAKGNLIAARGTRVNPLDMVQLSQALVFIDGDNGRVTIEPYAYEEADSHLTGNLWAQDWTALYEWIEPYPGEPSLDVTRALQKAKYDAVKMVKTGEGFFTSMGLDPLPATFWERSLLEQPPPPRKVVCHASAWDVELNNDLRIKMCIKIDHEDLVTIHHELGHDYYYNNYYTLPVLFQNGAHDGFHEAIGDAVALSITPGYLKDIGLLSEVSTNEKGVINKQMQDALQKVAFIPFGLLVDKWRWGVFAGTTTPASYNADWWKLRAELQGVAPAAPRGEEHFDPGAKYHIPGNTPYMRYFLSHIIQFQFHKAMCEAAGFEGPLHECSVYGNKAAGDRLKAMLALGSSKPWPEAMAQLTGSREMDGAALLEYFAPLKAYLDEQNAGRTCGWSGT